MKSAIKLVLLVPALALSGCAVNSYCEGEQKYERAQSLPPLQAVEGVRLPESASALKIPAPPANPVAFGETYKDEDGDDAVRCLDKPPALPEPAPPKPAEAKPAEAKPTEAKPAESPATPG